MPYVLYTHENHCFGSERRQTKERHKQKERSACPSILMSCLRRIQYLFAVATSTGSSKKSKHKPPSLSFPPCRGKLDCHGTSRYCASLRVPKVRLPEASCEWKRLNKALIVVLQTFVICYCEHIPILVEILSGDVASRLSADNMTSDSHSTLFNMSTAITVPL